VSGELDLEGAIAETKAGIASWPEERAALVDSLNTEEGAVGVAHARKRSAPQEEPRPSLELISSVELANRARHRHENGGVTYLWDQIIRTGGLLLLLVAFAKAGKTTFAHRLINALARGDDFLGRATRTSKVLVLAVEDPLESIEENALELLDGGHPNILYHPSPLVMTDRVLDAIVSTVKTQGADLVDLETLGAFWTVRDENDNAEVQRETGRLRIATRLSGVPWLVHAHTGKNEDRDDGGEIRGASSLFGAVDQALILKRKGRDTTQRQLYGRGRFGNTPAFSFDFDPVTKLYTFLGGDRRREDDVTAQKVATALRSEWDSTKVISIRAGLESNPARVASALRRMEGVECQGRGTRTDPYQWRRAEPSQEAL
jgi:AAA domain